MQCKNLEELIVNSCLYISDASIQDFLSRHNSIVLLNVSGCNLQDLNFRCKNLKTLIVSSNHRLKSPHSFGVLAKNCENLAAIELRGSPHISDECIDQLTFSTTISSPLSNHPVPVSYLTWIDLARCELLTDKSIQCVAQRCGKLKVLDISWCEKITDTSLLYLEQEHWKLSNFVTLKLFGCSKITGGAILSLHKAFYGKLHIKAITEVRDYLMIESI